MAINKMMRAVLTVLSYPELDVKKNYSLERELVEIASRRLKKPPIYRIWEHRVMREGYEIPVRIFTPAANDSNLVLLFFHGGGWVTGSIDSYDGVCSDMASETGRDVVSVDYRLAPEYRFPAGLEDCYAVTREIFLNDGLLGTKPREIALIGDSAGGNLAAAVSLMARDRGEFLPARQILIYPAVGNDHSDSSPFSSVKENGSGYLLTSKRIRDFLELYQSSEKDLQNPYLAPLLAEDLSGQPDTLVITAEYCPLRDEGEEYARRLRLAGGRAEVFRMPDALHGFFTLPLGFAHVTKAYELINQFLKE